MSEQQENYVITEACQVAAAHEQKRIRREIDSLKRELVRKIEAMRETERIQGETMPRTPIHAFLMQKFGKEWSRAKIADYDLGGDVHLHSAICQAGTSMTVQAALVYQIGEVCMVLSPVPGGE